MPKNINILYWSMSPYLPRFEGTSKEIAILRANNPGWVISPPGSFGHYGWDDAPSVRWLGWKLNPAYQWYLLKSQIGLRRCDLVHIFSWRIQYKQWMMNLNKPIVYTTVAESREQFGKEEEKVLKKIKSLVVSDIDDLNFFKKHSSCRVDLIRPGVERLNIDPPPLRPFTILMASAPWKKEHFSQKGIDLILEAARALPEIRWIFLWRGKYRDLLNDMIKQAGVLDRIKIIDRVVPIENILPDVHSVAGLYISAPGIKSYPHSLLESIAAARPVIITDNISLSGIVSKTDCGILIKPRIDDLIKGLKELIERYKSLKHNCDDVVNKYFSSKYSADKYLGIYRDIMS